MVLVCSKNNQKNAMANSNRINSLTELFESNRKKGKENTIQGILDACYGKRVPNHVKTALDSVCTPDSMEGSVGSRTTNHNDSSGSGGHRFITPPSLRIEGIKYCTNMDKIEGLIERGRNITLNTIIPDYKKYLLKVTNKRDQIERSLHLTKLENILENGQMNIKFLMVALAGKGFFFRTKRGDIRKSNPTKKEAIVEVKKYYSTYKEFKKFVIKVNLNKNNQDRLYEQYKFPVAEDVAIDDDEI
jgi:hypothetical protein